jgi:hypothetical protein
VANYRYLLGDSLTNEIYAELPLHTTSFTEILNRPGSFTGRMSLKQNSKLNTVLRSALQLGRSAIHVEREGALVWSGILWTDRIDATENRYELNANGWLSYLERRLLTETKTYALVEQVEIVKDLITWAQSQTGGDARIFLDDASPTGIVRDRTYEGFERYTIAELMVNLSNVINGFDFRFEPQWFEGAPRIRFLTHYPQTGRSRDLVVDFAGGAQSLSIDRDATSKATHVDAEGAGEGPAKLRVSLNSPDLLGSSLRLDALTTHADVSRTETLTGYALDRLQMGRAPLVLPRVTLRPDIVARVGTITPGDQARVICKTGFVDVDTTVKVTEQTVSVDSSGNESVTLNFSNTTAWGSDD